MGLNYIIMFELNSYYCHATYHEWPLHIDPKEVSRVPEELSCPRVTNHIQHEDFLSQQKHNANYPVNGRNPYVWNIDVRKIIFQKKIGDDIFSGAKFVPKTWRLKTMVCGIRSGSKSKAPHQVDWN